MPFWGRSLGEGVVFFLVHHGGTEDAELHREVFFRASIWIADSRYFHAGRQVSMEGAGLPTGRQFVLGGIDFYCLESSG
jgi:hypothetical protein